MTEIELTKLIFLWGKTLRAQINLWNYSSSNRSNSDFSLSFLCDAMVLNFIWWFLAFENSLFPSIRNIALRNPDNHFIKFKEGIPSLFSFFPSSYLRQNSKSCHSWKEKLFDPVKVIEQFLIERSVLLVSLELEGSKVLSRHILFGAS